MENIFVSTDWHLYSSANNMDPRHPYRSAKNLTELEDHVGNDMTQNDMWIFLGDLCDPQSANVETIRRILSKIPAYKVMVKGNHDTYTNMWYRDLGFDHVEDKTLVIHNMVFSHVPVKVKDDEINIHGHEHNGIAIGRDGNHINAYPKDWKDVCHPILLDDLLKGAKTQKLDEPATYNGIDQANYAVCQYGSDFSDKFKLYPTDETATTTGAGPKLPTVFVSPMDMSDWMKRAIKYDRDEENWTLKDPMSTYRSLKGNCHDQAWMADFHLRKMGYPTQCFFMVEYNGPIVRDAGDTHTFVTYQTDDGHWWFENAWKDQAGIHGPYDTIKDLTEDVLSKWTKGSKYNNHYIGPAKPVDYGTDLNDYVEAMLPSILLGESVDLLDEILFPDVETTKYFETDDEKYQKKADKAKVEQDDNVAVAVDESSRPNLWYHMVPKGADISKGIVSPRYMADHHMTKELNKSLNKYRDRIVDPNLWGYYLGKEAKDLTNEEILDCLRKFRGENGDSCIYLFKYPPTENLGPNMSKVLDHHDMYAVDLNAIPDIVNVDYTINDGPGKKYFDNVSIDEYFSKYDDNAEQKGRMLFASIPHISIVTKSGRIDPSAISQINSQIEADTKRIHDYSQKLKKKPVGNQNCLLCTWAIELACRGEEMSPRAVYSPRDVIFKIDTLDLFRGAKKIYPKNKANLKKIVSEAGEGARFYVHVNWSGSNGGHEFLLVNFEGKTNLVDAQAGVVCYIDSNEASDYFDINWKNSYIARVDNCSIDRKVLNYNNDKYLVQWDDSDEDLLNESWIIPKDNLEINLDQWAPGNPLWVTGSSGDGKSTLAMKLAKEHNAIIVTLDVILMRLSMSHEQFLERINDKNADSGNAYKMSFEDSPTVDYVLSHPNLPSNGKDPVTKSMRHEITQPVMIDTCNWLMKTLSTDPKYKTKLYIIEGCDICELDPDVMATKPLIIVGGSRLRSFMRRVKRDAEEKHSSYIKPIFKYIKKYSIQGRRLDDEKDAFYKAIKKRINEESVLDEVTTQWLSKPNLELNLEKFISGEDNVLLVTGISGGGKSTLSKKLAKEYGAEHIALDYVSGALINGLDYFYDTKRATIENHSVTIHPFDVEYVKTHPDIEYGKYEKVRGWTDTDHLRWAIDRCHQERNRKFIIEGCQVCCEDPEYLRGKPLIIVGTGAVKAHWRRTLRYVRGNDGSFNSWVKTIIKGATKMTHVKNMRLAALPTSNMRAALEESVQSLLNELGSRVPKILYHGSDTLVTGELTPHNSGTEGTHLFASDSYGFALAFAGKQWNDLEINQSSVNGKMYLTEILPGKFQEKFGDGGFVYELPGDTFTRTDTHSHEFISDNPVKPIKVHRVLDVLTELENSGVEVYRYPDLPPFIQNRKQYVLSTCKRHGLRPTSEMRSMLNSQGESGQKKRIELNEFANQMIDLWNQKLNEAGAKEPLSLTDLKMVRIVPAYTMKFHHIKAVREAGVCSKSCTALAWEYNGEPIAAVAVGYPNKDRAPGDNYNWIGNLAVVPKYRGRGLGHQILDYAVKKLGGNALAVYKDNEIAVKMYEKYGFKKGADYGKYIQMFYKVKPMPKTMNEAAFTTDIDPNHQQKGHKSLGSFSCKPLTKYVLAAHRNDPGWKLLKKLRPDNELTKTIGWFDGQTLVAIVSVSYPGGTRGSSDGSYNWITDLEVNKDYRGYGLGKQVLDYAVKTLGADAIGVDYSNKVAESMYSKYGFKKSKDSERAVNNKYSRVHLMYLREDLDVEIGLTEAIATTESLNRQQKETIANKYGLYDVGNTHEGEDKLRSDIEKYKKDKERARKKRAAAKRFKEKQHAERMKYRRKARKARALKNAKKLRESVDNSDSLRAEEAQINANTGMSGPRNRLYDSKRHFADASIADDGPTILEMTDKVIFNDPIDESAVDEKRDQPVYVILIHSGTALSKVIKGVTGGEFSHASISFDPSLHNMYSFARKDIGGLFNTGFKQEDIRSDFYTSRHIPYAIYMIPCTKSEVAAMKRRLSFFTKNATKFTFDKIGLVKTFFGISDNPEFRYFCSRFVADILKAGKPTDAFLADPSLVKPEDFKKYDNAYYVTGGMLEDYDKNLVAKESMNIITKLKLKKAVNEGGILDLYQDNPWQYEILDYQISAMGESFVDWLIDNRMIK